MTVTDADVSAFMHAYGNPRSLAPRFVRKGVEAVDERRLRQTAAPGYRASLVQRAREHADDLRRYDDESSEIVDTLVEMANLLIDDAAELAAIAKSLIPAPLTDDEILAARYRESLGDLTDPDDEKVAHTPLSTETNDEREAIKLVVINACESGDAVWAREAEEITDALLASAPWRDRHRGPITEAEVDAAHKVISIPGHLVAPSVVRKALEAARKSGGAA